ncbi:helix-turn-helix transcriptional regulator [Nocardia sp. NPDC052254]|uniref:helix-turn-helix transcriptional regulator n=1 Tax=Nocardia sp. NPDC052254 TaxID=3155681 RepID=UPI0034428DF5
MIVSTWTSVEVRALRTAALRITQEQFAERLGFQPPTIRKWERATRDRPVRGDSAAALDVELSRLTEEQRARFRMTVAAQQSSPGAARNSMTPFPIGDSLDAHGELSTYGIEDEVKRREFGILIGAATLSAAAKSPVNLTKIEMRDIRQLADRVTDLAQRDQVVGGAELVTTGLGELAHAKRLLEMSTFTERTGRSFMSAAGELATTTGWLAFDADIHPTAQQCFADAFALANQAGNDELTVHICLNAAHQSIALSRDGVGSPHRALAYLDRARQLTRAQPPGRIHALIAIREALARAILHDHVGFGRAVTTAWRELEAALAYEPPTECPRWLRFVTPAEIRSHESRGFRDLGAAEKSVDLLAADNTPEGMGARNRANYRASLAAAFACTGDVNNAVTQGLSVLDDLENQVSSTRTFRMLSPVRNAVDNTRHTEFTERYDDLKRKVVGVI